MKKLTLEAKNEKQEAFLDWLSKTGRTDLEKLMAKFGDPFEFQGYWQNILNKRHNEGL